MENRLDEIDQLRFYWISLPQQEVMPDVYNSVLIQAKIDRLFADTSKETIPVKNKYRNEWEQRRYEVDLREKRIICGEHCVHIISSS